MQNTLYLKLNFYKGGESMEIVNSICLDSSEGDVLIRSKYLIKNIANLSKNADMDDIFKKATEIDNAIKELEEMLIFDY